VVQTLADIGEFGLIRRIHRLTEREGVKAHGITLGIGDDCASFKPDEDFEILITCDCMIEGRHYLPEVITPFDLGRRAMVMNISDIGAMGGIPLYALVSLGLKKDTPVKDIEDIYSGFMRELNPLGAAIIGGNITGTDSSTFINITMTGKVESERMMRRSGARTGDVILVTGYPGEAAAGLKRLLDGHFAGVLFTDPLVTAYNLPVHRAREGRAVALSGNATAMIDISDGLMGDLGHICEESGVGAEIIRNKLPISEHMRELIDQQGWDIYELIIGDSDDYELIITCTPCNKEKVRAAIAEISDVPVTEIGFITSRDGMKIVTSDGVRHPVRPTGWDHFKDRCKAQGSGCKVKKARCTL
jgi:thiamine-monophosphate kinase